MFKILMIKHIGRDIGVAESDALPSKMTDAQLLARGATLQRNVRTSKTLVGQTSRSVIPVKHPDYERVC